MKRLFLYLTIAALSWGEASAIDLFKKKEVAPVDYTAWCDSVELPATFEGVTMYYPESVDGAAVVRGALPTGNVGPNNAFAAMLDFIVENLDPETEKIESVDYDNLSALVQKRSTQGSNNTETTYSYHLLLHPVNGSIEFAAGDLATRYREKGIVPRTLTFEKLNPGNNPRHRELVEEFCLINSTYLNSLAEYVKAHPKLSITHIDAMKGGEPKEGMTELEVKIMLGKPSQTRKSGERLRWVYTNDLVVIFTDGVVTKVIN